MESKGSFFSWRTNGDLGMWWQNQWKSGWWVSHIIFPPTWGNDPFRISTIFFQMGSKHQLSENDSIPLVQEIHSPETKTNFAPSKLAGPQSRKVYFLTPSIFEGTFGSFRGGMYIYRIASHPSKTPKSIRQELSREVPGPWLFLGS